MKVYPSIIETPEGTFLHLARPDAEPEDIPLTVEQLAALAAAASLAIRHAIQHAHVRRDWLDRDAKAS